MQYFLWTVIPQQFSLPSYRKIVRNNDITATAYSTPSQSSLLTLSSPNSSEKPIFLINHLPDFDNQTIPGERIIFSIHKFTDTSSLPQSRHSKASKMSDGNSLPIDLNTKKGLSSVSLSIHLSAKNRIASINTSTEESTAGTTILPSSGNLHPSAETQSPSTSHGITMSVKNQNLPSIQTNSPPHRYYSKGS